MSSQFPYKVGQTIFWRGPVWHHLGTVSEISPDGSWFSLNPNILVMSYRDLLLPIESYKENSFTDVTGVQTMEKIPVNSETSFWDSWEYPHPLPFEAWDPPPSADDYEYAPDEEEPPLDSPQRGYPGKFYQDMFRHTNGEYDPKWPMDALPYEAGYNVFLRRRLWHWVGNISEVGNHWYRLNPGMLITHSGLGLEKGVLRPGKDVYFTFPEAYVSIPTKCVAWEHRLYEGQVPRIPKK